MVEGRHFFGQIIMSNLPLMDLKNLAGLKGEAEEVEEHNQNMAKKDYLNLFENLFD